MTDVARAPGFWVNAPQIFLNEAVRYGIETRRQRSRSRRATNRTTGVRSRATRWSCLAPARLTQQSLQQSHSHVYHVESLRDLDAVLISVITTLSRDAALLAFEISIDFRHHRVALASRYLHVCHTK